MKPPDAALNRALDTHDNLDMVARVAELVDAPDLGSGALAWGFDSPLSHQDMNLQGGGTVIPTVRISGLKACPGRDPGRDGRWIPILIIKLQG